MNKVIPLLLHLLLLSIQGLVALVVLCGMYWCYLFLEYEGGFDRIFGIVFLQPIISVIAAGLTVFVVVIAGLPFRLVPFLRDWWKRNFMIPIIGVVAGVLLFIVSLFAYTEALVPYVWLITAFSIMHLVPPTILKRFYSPTSQTQY